MFSMMSRWFVELVGIPEIPLNPGFPVGRLGLLEGSGHLWETQAAWSLLTEIKEKAWPKLVDIIPGFLLDGRCVATQPFLWSCVLPLILLISLPAK
jgi:hypothetical protein